MGWKFGHIIFAHNFEAQKAIILDQLKLRLDLEIERPLTYEEVISREFEGSAISFYQGSTILSDFFMSQGSIISFPHLSSLDQSLISLSAYGDILSFYLQENVDSYGFAYYKKQKKIRIRQDLEGEIVIDEGAPLPEEGNNQHLSDTIFTLSKSLLGVKVDHLIFDPNISFIACQKLSRF